VADLAASSAAIPDGFPDAASSADTPACSAAVFISPGFSSHPYSPKCVEEEFSAVRRRREGSRAFFEPFAAALSG
jgi:hypothetical protein